MNELKIALLGLGNVGLAFSDYLARADSIARRIQICAVADSSGGLISENEERIKLAIEQKAAGRSIRDFARDDATSSDFIRRLKGFGVSVLVESLPSNLTDGQPALDLVRDALLRGINVVTVDKGPLAYGFDMLKEAAREGRSKIAFTGTTGVRPPDGISERVLEIRGVLNGTTNYILTEMQERGISFDDALAEAQLSGIAEPDPRLDIEGWDTAVKILILAKQLMGAECSLAEVSRIGIGKETESLITAARARGRIIRLIGRARLWQGRVRVSVAPKMIDSASPFYSARGTSKAAVFRTEKRELTGVGLSGRDQISEVILDDINRLTQE
jgi:homoserine dehydrogenase